MEESSGETPKPEGWTADRVASGLITSATYMSQGIATATEYGSKYIKVGADKIKSQIQPNAQQSEIDPKYHSLMKNVRYGTHVGVRVSSFVVNKLGDLAKYIITIFLIKYTSYNLIVYILWCKGLRLKQLDRILEVDRRRCCPRAVL